MPNCEGRTALVTGGSRGIGRAICLALADAGADVAVNYVRSADAAEEVAAEVRARGRRAETYQADVADYAACQAMTAAALNDFGTIDILINNAGIGSSAINRPTIAEAKIEDLERLLGANLWGPIYLSKLLAPQMRDAERGDIVMISSVATQRMSAKMGAYSIGKAGMEALAHTLAQEERQHGTRVNIVAPGLVDTDMGTKLISLIPGPDSMRERDATAPFGFVCQPEDIANAVAFLCGSEGRYITNQRITVDGGGF